METREAIRHISDTALWVSMYRAEESERPDAVFRDPFARRLAGERGRQIAASMAGAHRYSWSYVARTWLVDRVVDAEIRRGADVVINLAAGLDARPYRMDLPASLRWIEVDLAPILEYKAEFLDRETPRCRLERIALDLADVPARRAVFERIGAGASRVLVISEGLIVYFDAESVGELARDLAAPASFRRWATDLLSPGLLRMLQKSIGNPLASAGSPLRFAPAEGPAFFERVGWRVVEANGLLQTAARLHRLSFLMRVLAMFPDSKGQKPDRPWGGVCELENVSHPAG